MRMEPAAEEQHSKNSLSQQSVGTASLFKKKERRRTFLLLNYFTEAVFVWLLNPQFK